MVLPQNRGTPIKTLKHCNPYDRGPPKNGTPNFRKPHMGQLPFCLYRSVSWSRNYGLRFREALSPSCGWLSKLWSLFVYPKY